MANQILSRISNGESFDALLEAYGTDPGMQAEPYKRTGYLVGPYETQRDYLPEFKQAALALQNAGEISGVIKTEAGYHIMQLLDRMQAKTVSYEEVSSTIRTLLEKQAQQNAFDELVKGWYKEE
jgi:parvulin-like peptidyl-prolyl isomerase